MQATDELAATERQTLLQTYGDKKEKGVGTGSLSAARGKVICRKTGGYKYPYSATCVTSRTGIRLKRNQETREMIAYGMVRISGGRTNLIAEAPKGIRIRLGERG